MQGTGKLSSATRATEVTPNDATEYSECRAIYVGSGGDLAITTRGGDSVTLVAVPTGSLLPVDAKIILSTGTTASSIVIVF